MLKKDLTYHLRTYPLQDVMDIEKLADVNAQIKALEKEKETLTKCFERQVCNR